MAENTSPVKPIRLPIYTGLAGSGTHAENEGGRPHHFQPKPKVELTMFNGTDVKYWVRQCNRNFEYYSTFERDKIPVVALYFDKNVEKWFHNHLVGRPQITWDELSRFFFD